MTWDWLQQRIDADEAVFGPLHELLLTIQQRRALIMLFTDHRHVAEGTLEARPDCGRFQLYACGLPVRVPARGGMHLGAVGGE